MLFKPVMDRPGVAYCGPAAIAILTGVPLTRIEKMIRRKRGGFRDALGRKIAVRGSYTWEVVKILKRLGCKVHEMKNTESTITKFAADTAHIGAAFLVEVTGHFVTTCQGVLKDNRYVDGIPATQYHKPTKRVRRAWRIIAPAAPLFTVTDPIKAARPPKPPRDIQAERIAGVLLAIKRWEAKRKRAETALKKLRARKKYYERKGRLTGKADTF